MTFHRKRSTVRSAAVAAAAMVATLGAVVPLSATAAPADEVEFPLYPEAALVRELGEIPTGVGGDGGRNLPAVPGLGITLGGVGSGSFMINQSGTFGPWHFGGSPYGEGNAQLRYQNRILPQAAFHVREQVGDSAASVTTLATDGPDNASTPKRSWGDVLPAWNRLSPGEAEYAALYPFGWMDYRTFQTDISMRFYSPMVPGDDKLTSLPIAYFDVTIENTTDDVADVSTMFTMPNVEQSVAGFVPTSRTGLQNEATVDDETGITSVTMTSNDAQNSPDAYRSEWTIAARPDDGQKVSYVTSWNASGDGSDIYSSFSDSGQLPDRAIDQSQTAGAISVSATLQPGERTVVPFVLSWDFPQITTTRTSGSGASAVKNTSIWMRRYTEYYGAQITDETNAVPGDYNRYIPGTYPFNQSRTIAKDALINKDAWLAKVHGWWSPLATNPDVPDIVRTASLNQLSAVPFKSTLWAAGLVSSTAQPTLGHRLGSDTPGVRAFAAPDSAAGGNSQMGADTSIYGYLAYNRFYPSIERDNLLAIAEGIERDPSGNPEAPYAGSDPYVSWVPGAAPQPGVSTFQDVPAKRIARFYAYARLNDDPAFLEKTYPAMKRQFEWLRGMIPANETFPRGSQPDGVRSYITMPNSYNVIPVQGADVYDSLLYLLSLEVMIDSGEQTGESPQLIENWKAELEAAKPVFDDTFWDEDHGWYKYTEYDGDGTAVLLDTFFAQHIAEQVGLPDLVDPTRYQTHLTNAYGVSLAAPDRNGNIVGARNLSLPEGVKTYPLLGTLRTGSYSLETTPLQESSIWTGTNYFVSGTYTKAGKRFGDANLTSHGAQLATGVAHQVWGDLENGYAFNSPEGWESNHWNRAGDEYITPNGAENYTYAFYERSMAVWEAYEANAPVFDIVDLDKSDLVALVAEAEAFDAQSYTTVTWERFTAAVRDARAVLDDPSATQERVDAIAQMLRDAITGLEARQAPLFTEAGLPDAVVGESYRAVVSASGTAPVEYAAAAGELPGGLSLDTITGAITGTPTAAGTFDFTIVAENSVGAGERSFTLRVAGPRVTAAPGGTTTGSAGASGSARSDANGGRLSATGGNLPVALFAGGLFAAACGTVLITARRARKGAEPR